MGHNKAGERRMKRAKRRRKHERRAAALWAKADVHVYECPHWGGMRMSIRKNGRWIDFGEAAPKGLITRKRLKPWLYCNLRAWVGSPLFDDRDRLLYDKFGGRIRECRREVSGDPSEAAGGGESGQGGPAEGGHGGDDPGDTPGQVSHPLRRA